MKKQQPVDCCFFIPVFLKIFDKPRIKATPG